MGEYSELNLRRCLSIPPCFPLMCLQATTPPYASYFEKKNSAFLEKVWYLISLPVPEENWLQ